MNKKAFMWDTLTGWIITLILFIIIVALITTLLGEKKDLLWNNLLDLLKGMFSGGNTP